MMNRRSFFKVLLPTIALGTSAWLFMRDTAFGKIFTSWLGKGKRVDNALPTPSFSVRSFDNDNSIRCMVIGDWGTGDTFQKRIAKAMQVYAVKENQQFIISTGDNFYPNGVDSPSDPQFKEHWEDIYTGASLQIPWYLVLGNHDYRTNPDAEIEYHNVNPRWNMPARYFTFLQQQSNITVQFFMLDTEVLHTSKKNAIATQLAWLEKELSDSKALWKVAVGHHMIRSHGVYGDQPFMVSQVKPLLDKYGVQLYLNGHDHDVQYLKSPDDNFACIISGGGGGARNTSYGTNTRYAYTNGGFVALSFTQKYINAQFVNAEGNVIYADDVSYQ